MWLHVISDDKFTGFIQSIFEAACPDENIYALVPRSSELLEKKGFHSVSSAETFSALVFSIENLDGIIFNPLLTKSLPWLQSIPASIPVIWYTWGMETYKQHHKLRSSCLYLPETKKLMANHFKFTLVREFKRRIENVIKGRFRNLDRVNYFVCQLEQEYNLIRDIGFLSRETQWYPGAVATIEDAAFGIEKDNELGVDIKVGNSADPTNNHIDAFLWLKKQNIDGRKIIVPLSYGNENYRDYVIKAGEKYLGSNFVPLIDFLPIEEYNGLNNQCGIVIMNHLRQQALGNIMADLWRGSKLYMNNTVVYQGYKNWGLEVFQINSDEVNFCNLEKDVIRHNQSVLLRKLSKASVVSSAKKMLEDVKKNALCF